MLMQKNEHKDKTVQRHIKVQGKKKGEPMIRPVKNTVMRRLCEGSN
jgi:hypothetical protein